MSFLFHFGDLLLDGKDPVDDSVDKIVICFPFSGRKFLLPIARLKIYEKVY
jgi:hypothetical protein